LLVIKDGVGPVDAAVKAMDGSGIGNLKSLLCIFGKDAGDSVNPPIEVVVKVDERRGFVQAKSTWLKKRELNQNSFLFSFSDFDFVISRLTGLATLTRDGTVVPGACDYANSSRKF